MSTIDFHSLAKTELHCHLDGSLSLQSFASWQLWPILTYLLSDEELTMSLRLPTVRIFDYLKMTIRPSFKLRKPWRLLLTMWPSKLLWKMSLHRSPFCTRIVHRSRTHCSRNYRCCLWRTAPAQEEFGIGRESLVCGMRQWLATHLSSRQANR